MTTSKSSTVPSAVAVPSTGLLPPPTARTSQRPRGRETAFLPTVPGLSARTAPATVAADGENLVVSSWILGAVQVVDPTTGDVLVDRTDFAVPLNAIAFRGDLAVAELGTGSVILADRGDPAQKTAAATGLAIPSGLAALGDDLWVADTALGTVLQIVDDGSVVTPPTVVASGLAGPEGLAALPDGDLLVVEAAAGRLSRIDGTTGDVTVVADDLGLGAPPPPMVPPTWLFNGVAVGTRGRVYVTGDVANVVYTLRGDSWGSAD